MKKFKKIISSMLAITSAFSLCSLNKTNAYYAGQKHTWRIYEKVSTLNMEWYSSTILNNNNYTFNSCVKKQLIVNSSNFYSNYSTSLKALTTSYNSPPKINGTGFLSMSTWYTPTEVNKFSVQYSYETSNNAKITPIYVLVGDFNQDSYVNKLDAELILEYSASVGTGEQPTYSEKALLAGDINNDGIVDARDASSILSFVGGSITHF